ncbi:MULTISPECIES: D-amino-acid transaminase [Acidiphilium]|jgi:D-alanine transaminase|uniref:Probable branched-chain-amino-acid aminotransferase n=1 Tax=Acidiphilium multivorum (strain DSM 11245 / JCM 8867 / NBRC 100883 / AIU 301) TaxID=926570 RepID=F0J483_ACIMA|nr:MULTISPECIES: D-amino-acid transaminase [Acidiphilium]EGO96692.1 Aminotransferase, class IV [Acidiphilium sp. PM]KDM67208.1 D-alanine aminotransferase Dat [Acidiphilium sp. JA12-A1]MBS3023025.1 D-amino-acid transaminase [Acidiphilium multivorum]BAJ82224.1 D-amino acid aminotransferase [Acidiphilium multivorum AIU301]GAN73584.1 D-amino acid aminotransferase [Acidiphilium multivorum AIU301]
MSRIAYVNGRYVPQREASVNVEDRGYQFGDGVYEVIHVHDGRFVDTGLHLARLARSLRELAIPKPMEDGALLVVLREVVRRNRIREGIVYMQVSRGVARRDHAFPRDVAPALVVTARHGKAFPREIDTWTGTAITAPDIRWGRVDIKTVNLLPNCLAKQKAREAGAYEAILIDRDGNVTEGSSTTVWAVDEDGVLRTRHLDHHILPGCTRAAVISLMEEAGIRFEERGLSEAELRAAREIFLTSATSYVKPMVRLDGVAVGEGTPGPVARRLFELFARHADGAAHNVPPASPRLASCGGIG